MRQTFVRRTNPYCGAWPSVSRLAGKDILLQWRIWNGEHLMLIKRRTEPHIEQYGLSGKMIILDIRIETFDFLVQKRFNRCELNNHLI